MITIFKNISARSLLVYLLGYNLLVAIGSVFLYMADPITAAVLSDEFVFILISNLVSLLLYICLGKVNFAFRKAAIVKIILFVKLIIFYLLNNTFSDSVFYACIEQVVDTALVLLFEYFFVKGFITIFSVYNQPQYINKWKNIWVYTLINGIVGIIPAGLTIFGITNIYVEFVAIIVGIFTLIIELLEFIYIINTIRFLKNKKVDSTVIEIENR